MNFRGYVAVPLERYCRKYLDGKFTADDIDVSEFYEAMLSIIDKLELNGINSIENFKSKYFDIQKKSYNQIIKEGYDYVKIFDEFKKLTNVTFD